ncbi:hypothetical protein [Mucilaginibacter aquariorum]|uniref:Uncharacterized protein n=1 Tax=Mucilaginibacter aquariorum TaxID=2967225 RepID=A0ABT1SZE7_9SPHI|nr:hypothetical protein [Mucilaginibacter aquariorum]MCQ6957721.1 hypothetical protein [Mucilaginibacter aquariorum]
MKRFIAYFDYLGFKDFIEKNDLEFQHQIMNNNFRDIEIALSKGKTIETRRGFIPDIDESNINCMNFSDTVVFWTNDDSEESLREILRVAFTFNYHCIEFTFPLKGAIVYGEVTHVDFRQQNGGGGIYNINSFYGKGIIEAYLKAERQHWAGTVIDSSVIEEIISKELNPEEILKEVAKKYMVPYKEPIESQEEEYALRLVKGDLPEAAFQNVSKQIARNFGEYNKSVEHHTVQQKLANTITYLKSFIP